MAQIILFGGGDGGGIRITANGVEPIPPFDPGLRLQLRALNNLARAGRLVSEKVRAQLLRDLIGKCSNAVLTQLEHVVGEIDAEHGLVYQDDDGGFICGSTGKPPIPFPWPVDPRRTARDLMARGIINPPTLEFLERAAEKKMDVFAVARDPQSAAKKIGVTLTPQVEQSLAALKIDSAKIEDKTDRAVVDFYSKVVADGRYITEWAVDPTNVASRLKLQVPQEVIDRIILTRDSGVRTLGPGAVMSPYAVAVVVAIVIVLWDREAELPVIDRSGLAKL